MNQDRLDELIDKYASGTISPEELRELLDWYRSAEIETIEWPAEEPEEKDHLKGRMLVRLQAQIRAMPETPKFPVEDPLVIPLETSHYADPETFPYVGGSRRRLFRLRTWQVAACLAIIFSSIWIGRLFLGRTRQPAWVEVRNPSGMIQSIRLPDSSEVWLNAASIIRYSPDLGKRDGASREIYLEGEGYFDVVEDRAHAFIVHAGSLTTTVLGTRFDVKSFSGERQASVSVVSGKVRVGDSSRVLDVLTAARQLQVDVGTGNSRTVSVDTGQVAGWRQGRLQFPGQTMEEITASLARWYNIQFVFAKPETGRCRYYLNFENTISLQHMLAALEETTGLNFQEDVPRHMVTISGHGCQ